MIFNKFEANLKPLASVLLKKTRNWFWCEVQSMQSKRLLSAGREAPPKFVSEGEVFDWLVKRKKKKKKREVYNFFCCSGNTGTSREVL
jgi:hypothetical protein